MADDYAEVRRVAPVAKAMRDQGTAEWEVVGVDVQVQDRAVITEIAHGWEPFAVVGEPYEGFVTVLCRRSLLPRFLQ